MRTPLAILTLATMTVGCGGPGEQTSTEAISSEQFLVYFGTGGKESQGIYGGRFDAATGELTPTGLAAEAPAPSFLEVHPDETHLYAVGRTADQSWQGVAAYELDRATGKLTFLNRVSGKGQGPCHVTVDSQGRTVAVANYSSGTVASMRVEDSGSLTEAVSFFQHEGSSVNQERQRGPHAHSVNFSPDDRYLIAADLGIDKVLVYRHDASTGELAEHGSAAVAPGGGPRHFTFHPSGKVAYVINELTSTVTAFSWNAESGELTEIQTIDTLPADFEEANKTAEILVHPSGKFLYGSNRGHDSIAVFSIDEATGRLTFVERMGEGVAWPRNFRIDPTGKFMLIANRDANDVKVYRIDQASGRLSATGGAVSVPGPICVRFVKAL